MGASVATSEFITFLISKLSNIPLAGLLYSSLLTVLAPTHTGIPVNDESIEPANYGSKQISSSPPVATLWYD